MKRLVFDIEANGLLPKADTIWCLVAKDLDTGEEYNYIFDNKWTTEKQKERCRLENSNNVQAILGSMLNPDEEIELIGHNIIDYDLPLLEKVLGWTPDSNTKITDTLVMSRLSLPDRPGGHGLGPWSERIGRVKPEHEDWTQYSEEMLHRCTEDVRNNYELYFILEKELKDFGESVEIEHEVQRIISKQERDGCYFDRESAEELVDKLETRVRQIDSELERRLPTYPTKLGASVTKPFKKDGSLIKRLEHYGSEGFKAQISGPFTRLEWKQVDLNSDKQKKEWLLSIGWKPTEWNTSPTTGERTSPKLTEDSFDSIPDGIGDMLKERSMLSHRLSQVKGLLGHVREDGRIPAGANTIGTPTGRMRHRIVVNIPALRAPYGEEVRSLFCAKPGYKFVGHDASGLELRMLAHYMNDQEFTEQVLHGDIHSYNQRLAGLPTRDSAKTFIYAFIYGAGDAKLGSIVNGSASEGAKLRNRFLSALPKLGKLIDQVKQASKRGYLVGLDGRKIWMRRDDRGDVMTHKALNTLLQAAGAIVMKKSLCLLTEAANDLDYTKVIDMHDEGQNEVSPEHAELFASLAVKSIEDAGKHFNLNIPLAAEADIGVSWKDTH